VTGISQVDKLQDDTNNLVGGQFGKGGLLQPVGDAVSKEGMNRAERGGKDDSGSYGGAAADSAASAGNSVAGGASSVGSSITGGAKSAGGYVGSLWGGKK
jgi:hypothetical protein